MSSACANMTIHQFYPKWLTSRANRRECCVIDVRTPEEYATGRVPGAQLMPLDRLQTFLGELPKQSDIHLICRSGMRSLQAASILAGAGFTRLINIEGGTLEWVRAGYPVETEKDASGRATA